MRPHEGDNVTEGKCMQCDEPIDIDNASTLFDGATTDGTPVVVVVCSACALREAKKP